MRQVLTNTAQLGHVLAARRKTSQLSQSALAAKLAISQNRLSELETNPGKLTLERILTLANLLGLELIIQDKKSPASKVEW